MPQRTTPWVIVDPDVNRLADLRHVLDFRRQASEEHWQATAVRLHPLIDCVLVVLCASPSCHANNPVPLLFCQGDEPTP
jgi:hypothetical protein